MPKVHGIALFEKQRVHWAYTYIKKKLKRYAAYTCIHYIPCSIILK